jgi:threonylcarbamoyladenosine tRNA methylthiotransferase MtaB
MKITLKVLGCKVSQYDAALLEGMLRSAGGSVQPAAPDSEIFLVCGCAVTHKAAQEAQQIARRFQRINPQAAVIFYGCIGQHLKSNGFVGFGPGEKGNLLTHLGFIGLDSSLPHWTWRRTRGLIQVQEGCDHHCTYCIVPQLRGRSCSKPMGQVLEEASVQVASGLRELVITGVHLSAYGRDLPDKPTLLGLAEGLNALPGLVRLRISSLEPMDLTLETMAGLGKLEHICPHLHLPLQSGSDTILKRMGRGYSRDHYLALAAGFARIWPDGALTTDILIGFPGETAEDFAQTLEIVGQVRFPRMHLFRFSPRPGTPAADFPDQVPATVQKERLQHLKSVGTELARAYRSRFLGRNLPILVERISPQGEAQGLTANYLRLRVPSPFCRVGELVEVNVEDSSFVDNSAFGGEKI